MRRLLLAPLVLALYGPVPEVTASSSHELCLQQSSTYSDPDDSKVIYQDCMFDASGKINPEKEANGPSQTLTFTPISKLIPVF